MTTTYVRRFKKDTLPVLLADFYKTGHMRQYPNGTKTVFSNWIPRTSRIPGIRKVVSFGFQRFTREYLVDYFNEHFFYRNKKEVIAEYERFMTFTMGPEHAGSDHIAALHDLGYLPIEIRVVQEGERVPIGVPMLTVINTHPAFFWVTNFIETLISCEIWQPMTDATLSYQYRQILDAAAMKTTGSTAGVEFQGHDFSMRGMVGVSGAASSSGGNLLNFVGTDTMAAIAEMEWAYDANIEEELVGCSIPATEHSVECANAQGTMEGEYIHTLRLITEIYPKGMVAKVSDTIDLWTFITTVLPRLKKEIMGRDGKLVIRPDSGDPVDILCGRGGFKLDSGEYRVCNGDPAKQSTVCENITEAESKGVVELLWDIFGGTVTEQGYKLLDSHIGAIYGDSITIDRTREICKRLEAKGFASTNMVLGIGSFTFQYNTRDTFGFAMKSTYAVINDEEVLLYKDPITDSGMKKSLKGLCVVVEQSVENENDKPEFMVIDKLDMAGYTERLEHDVMKTIFKDGEVYNSTTLKEIRKRLLN